LISVLFLAQSIPNFGPILSFIGGSTVCLSSFVLPLIFYWLLCRRPEYDRQISVVELVLMIVCVVLSIFGGISATYSSADALFGAKFTPPCYINRTQIPS
jgi:solute carrier family 32 (vesicular inhibitory amino acid transporter)